MMRWRRIGIAVACFALAACGQPGEREESGAPSAANNGVYEDDVGSEDLPELAPVDEALLGAPNSAFIAIEPSEVGVFAAPTVEEALLPLLGPESHEEGASVQMSMRTVDGIVVADIVRADIPDDSVAAGHVRIEFRQEPEGWFPTNAYRRFMCRRGARANQWTTELCP